MRSVGVVLWLVFCLLGCTSQPPFRPHRSASLYIVTDPPAARIYFVKANGDLREYSSKDLSERGWLWNKLDPLCTCIECAIKVRWPGGIEKDETIFFPLGDELKNYAKTVHVLRPSVEPNMGVDAKIVKHWLEVEQANGKAVQYAPELNLN